MSRIVYPVWYICVILAFSDSAIKRLMSQLIDPDSKAAMRARLARIAGRLHGVQRLLDAEAEREKIVQQLAASRKALVAAAK